MTTPCSALKPLIVVSSAFVEQQLYNIHMPTPSSALKPIVGGSAFIKHQLYNIHLASLCS